MPALFNGHSLDETWASCSLLWKLRKFSTSKSEALCLINSFSFFPPLFCLSYIQDRLEIILDTWIATRHVPSPEEVSKGEDFNFMWSKAKGEVSHGRALAFGAPLIFVVVELTFNGRCN